MIEDKKLGLKIAENPEEAAREVYMEGLKKRIIQTEIDLELDKLALKHLESKRKV